LPKGDAAFQKVIASQLTPGKSNFTAHREMLIQHIRRVDILPTFSVSPQFHRENNIAQELPEIISVLPGNTRHRLLLKGIEHYYRGDSSQV
jgi:hypothetical protein